MAYILSEASTLLFVPASRPDRYAKALQSGAGVVIVDLEDAVGPDQKEAARDQITDGFGKLGKEQLSRMVIRINAADSAWHAQDVRFAKDWVRRGLAGVMLPKADSTATLQALATSLGPKAEIIPLIESLAGFDALNLMARAPQVARLAFGHLDFQVDLGMRCGPDESELTSVRLAIVMVSRRAGLPPPADGVTIATDDDEILSADAQRSRRLGFGAKLCIHPSQVARVAQVFAPTASEIEWARRVVDAADTGTAVFKLDGRMVDAPVILQARRTLAAIGGAHNPPSQ
jgi:citrate lyase subunit beta / citryl-CoA lyase